MSVVVPSDPSTRRTRHPLLGPAALFFGLTPVLIGLLLGATRAGVALYFPWSIGIAFWVIVGVGTWTCMYACTALAGYVLRPWRPPLWAILAAGAVLGSLPARYVIYGTAHLLRGQMLDGREPRAMPPLEPSVEFVVYYLQGWAGVYAIWIVLGLVFERFFGLPRYSREGPVDAPAAVAARLADTGTATMSGAPSAASGPAAMPVPAPASATAPGPSDPPLLARLPEKLGRNVLALEAEDHYVRVHTDLGSTLVLARLSDAIADLGSIEGLRVHRSYWVRRDAVQRVTPHGKGLMLRLSNGLDVPVSQGYKELARQAGLQPGG